LNQHLFACKSQNVTILKALVRIFGKFERLMNAQGRVDFSDTQKRDMLIQAQQSLLAKITNPHRGGPAGNGLLLRLQDVKQVLQ